VEQVHIGPELASQTVEQHGDDLQIARRLPLCLERPSLLCRLVVEGAAAHAVRMWNARYAALRADRPVSHGDVLADRLDGLVDGAAVRVAIHHHALARGAAQELIHRRVQGLAADIPERGIDGADRRHRDGTASPVRALVEVLPRVLDLPRIATDEQRDDVIDQVTRDRELTSVQRGVAESEDSVLGDQFQCDEVPSRRADDHARVDDLHEGPRSMRIVRLRTGAIVADC
jgi:hypothetical protein